MAPLVGRDEEQDLALGRFLRDQSRAAGLSTRDIERRFQFRADQERERLEAGQDAPADPVSTMKFSKSHLDRLFRGTASLPSKRFVTMFLEITSSASGVQPALHGQLCRQAHDLLSTAHRYRRSKHALKSTASTPQLSDEVAVATLQVQLDLERAHRAEDKLRWALSDAQLLMTTLLQIISTLRDLIIDLDTQHARALHVDAEPDTVQATANQRLEALTHKAKAETQLARVSDRRILLETLWEQAHGNVRRLSQHPDITNVTALPAGPALPQEIIPAELLTQPALTDIGNALGKAEEINETEERKAHEWQQVLTSATQLQPADEHAILLAATRLTDSASRKTALHALINGWSRSSDTRDALARLSIDDQLEIRVTATHSLAQAWPGDSIAREALAVATRDADPKVQTVAVWGLAQGWAGDPAARDALVTLTLNRSALAREVAADGLTEGWSGDTTARDALLPLIHDSSRQVRESTVELLIAGWPGDVVTRDALLGLLLSDDVAVREIAAEGLSVGWPNDTSARDAFLDLLHDTAPTVRWAAERGLSPSGPPSDDSQSAFARGRQISESGASRSPQRDLTERARSDGSHGETALIAARIPRDYITETPLAAISALHRGIGFDPGITIISGDNGTGKTILLTALAIRMGCLEEEERRRLHYLPPLAVELAEKLDLLWHEKLTSEKCIYLSGHFDYADRQPPLKEMMSQPPKHRLFLLDEPMVSRDLDSESQAWDRISQMAQEGCQFIIVKTHLRHAVPASAKIVRFSSRRIRDRMDYLVR